MGYSGQARLVRKGFLHEEWQIDSRLTPSEVAQHIASSLDTRPFSLGLRYQDGQYHGHVDSQGFRIMRFYSSYRSSWKASAVGRITGGADGTTVIVKIGQNSFMQFFDVVWFGGLAVMTLGMGYSLIVSALQGKGVTDGWVVLVPLGIGAAWYYFLRGIYRREAKDLRAYLKEKLGVEFE